MKFSRSAVAVLVLAALSSQQAFATNGAAMMAVGSQNTALGGTGVANFTGADSAFANPAMLGKSQGKEVTGGIVLFKPDVTNNGMGGSVASSSSNTSYIPDVSYSNRMSDTLTFGVAMAGIAGMGVDYTGANAATHIKAKTALSILHIIPTIAYNQANYGIGFSPVVQYGSLMISYNNGAAYNAAEKADTKTSMGYALGGYYDVSSAITLAASYSSEIKAKYGNQLSGAGQGFRLCSPVDGVNCFGAPFGDDLNQPAQIKFGVAMAMSDAVKLTADYKSIQYGSAGGWKDFNWKNQAVISVGAKYSTSSYWIGAGYNHADNPIAALGDTSYRNAVVDFFNNMMFPGIVKSSYTFGGGYTLSKEMDIEASAVITPKVNTSVNVTNINPALPANATSHAQSSYSVSLRYKF
ncbi:OmpP1/FadL family transporter [Sideroxydans sp.]